jgi:hypothetical protein
MLNVFIAVLPFGSFRGEKALPVFSCCPPLTSTIEVSLFGFMSSAQLKQKLITPQSQHVFAWFDRK